MCASRIAVTLAGAAGASLLAVGCGSSSSSKGQVLPSAGPAANPLATTSVPATTEVGGKLGFTGLSICETVPIALVEAALGQPSGAGKPNEPKAGTHACSWVAKHAKRAIVAVIYDSSLDRVKSQTLDFTNRIAGTDFSASISTGNDVGARNVTAYGLVNGKPYVATSDLSKIANKLNDFIVDRDKAASN